MTCEPSPLGGARFIATFSSQLAGDGKEAQLEFGENTQDASGSPCEAVGPLSVLVIDDVESSREYVREALVSLGHRCAVASSAEAGVTLAQDLRPELVFIDLQMPEVDGFETARRLGASLGQGPVLVAMSAARSARIEKRVEKSGFSHFSGKPMGLQEISHAVVLAQKQLKKNAMSGATLAPAGFSEPRFQELAGIKTEGASLLERMVARVLEELPRAYQELERISCAAMTQPQLTAKAVHELSGLFALIGAAHAHALSARLEERLAGNRPADSIERNEGDLSTLILEARRVEASLRDFQRTSRK